MLFYEDLWVLVVDSMLSNFNILRALEIKVNKKFTGAPMKKKMSKNYFKYFNKNDHVPFIIIRKLLVSLFSIMRYQGDVFNQLNLIGIGIANK